MPENDENILHPSCIFLKSHSLIVTDLIFDISMYNTVRECLYVYLWFHCTTAQLALQVIAPGYTITHNKIQSKATSEHTHNHC